MVLWKQWNMKQKKEDGFLGAMMAPMTTSLIVSMAFSLIQHVASEIVLVLLHNIEITKYFSYEPRFNGVFSRDDLPRTKDRA